MQAINGTMRRFLFGATLLYCIGIVVLTLFWTTQIYPAWWLELSSIFALYLFAPVLILVPLAILMRSVLIRGTVMIGAVAFLTLFSSQLLPPDIEQTAASQLRVVTYNTLALNQQPDSVVATIRAQNADIVAIQELSPSVAAAFEQQLRAEYPYQALHPDPRPHGLGLLSRYPIEVTNLEPEFRGQRAVVQINGQPVTIFNVHPSVPSLEVGLIERLRLPIVRDYDTSLRASQLTALLAAIDQTPGPILVAGDFNTSDREPAYAAFTARLRDAYAETAWGFGFTFPNQARVASIPIPMPLVRIDYIFSGGGIAPAAARADCSNTSSDHCLVVADLYFEGR